VKGRKREIKRAVECGEKYGRHTCALNKGHSGNTHLSHPIKIDGRWCAYLWESFEGETWEVNLPGGRTLKGEDPRIIYPRGWGWVEPHKDHVDWFGPMSEPNSI